MRALRAILFLVVFVALGGGCGKKEKGPEPAAGEVLAVEMGKAEVFRGQAPGSGGSATDKLEFNVRVTNTLDGPLTVDRVHFVVKFGQVEVGGGETTPSRKIETGATEPVHVIHDFAWKEGADYPGEKIHVTGTLYWTGPKGNTRDTPFEIQGDYVILNP